MVKEEFIHSFYSLYQNTDNLVRMIILQAKFNDAERFRLWISNSRTSNKSICILLLSVELLLWIFIKKLILAIVTS